jgi:ligand-binding SRPBCC domain-containing protein
MIRFYKHSGVYTLVAEQSFSATRQHLWNFLSKPGNLSDITPESMGFKVTSPLNPPKMYAGQIITYKVSPFKGLRSNWVTEITHVQEGWYFVDEQRFGPYRFWHHKHFLEESDKGVKMTDEVTYKMPLGFIGRLVNQLLVRPRLRKIFEFRQQILRQQFGN